MERDIVTLHQMLDCLCRNGGMTICIHDISSVLQNPLLNIPIKYRIHSGAFCDAAKSTAKGFRSCLKCKIMANEKASRGKEMFCGHCCYGIYKVVYPVVINDRVACIVYIGNMTDDRSKLVDRIHKTCRITGVDPGKLLAELEGVETVEDPEIFQNIAKMIAGHIRYLDSIKPAESSPEERHWAVNAIKHYADISYDKDILLSDVAKLYHVNHQYVGKLFAEQIGLTFRQYLNEIRLRHAAEELKTMPGKNITQIAMDCGFVTVTYFNRVFKEKYEMTPHAYRLCYKQY